MTTPESTDAKGDTSERSQSDCLENAWNPGLESTIPPELMSLATIFRPENSFIDYTTAQEIAAFTGLEVFDVIHFRPERLVVHALLIRVTADLHAPDGPNYEDLGISLRSMVHRINENYAKPCMAEFTKIFDDTQAESGTWIEEALAPFFHPTTSAASEPKSSLLGRLFGSKSKARVSVSPPAGELDLINAWTERQKAETDLLARACLEALIKVVGSIYGKRGRLVGDKDLIRDLTVRRVSNTLGSIRIGMAVNPVFQKASEAEGYQFVPAQAEPVIMNVKGASAAGKSTIRHDQMRLAKKLNIPWESFAVISPDYWRKYLLDYDSLGAGRKYAAMLTGKELEIVDRKLDRYMAVKAKDQGISHLLIDRFRFDSFLLEHEKAADTRLLTRFGEHVFLFFVITSPEQTVERAYQRGIKTGRYKAVDDLLHHNVEAYTGMPDLFFSWASYEEKRIHFEFLDNNVAEGERPRTVAYGWNGDMVILDVEAMLNIDRYCKINMKAKRPEDVLDPANRGAAQNAGFLARCRKLIHTITFADYETARMWGRMEHGEWVWKDKAFAQGLSGAEYWLDGLRTIGWDDTIEIGAPPSDALDAADDKGYTLGRWAPAVRAAATGETS